GFGHDALHTSVRTAVLAAHADLPGPASATPTLRMLLTQPPEPLSLDGTPGSSASDWLVPAQRTQGDRHEGREASGTITPVAALGGGRDRPGRRRRHRGASSAVPRPRPVPR